MNDKINTQKVERIDEVDKIYSKIKEAEEKIKSGVGSGLNPNTITVATISSITKRDTTSTAEATPI